MPNVLRDLFLPNASQYYNAAESVGSARKEYDAAFAALRDYEDRQESVDRDAVWDELARAGKLTGTTAAKALGQIRAAKSNRLASAQMQAQMYRAAARQRQQELGTMAKSATSSDLLNLGVKVGGAALGMYGAGMLGGGAAAGGVAPGAAQSATRAAEMIQPGAKAMPGVAAAAANTSRYNPLLAGIGESLAGIQGQPFTQAATRGRYPGLTQNPWTDYMQRQSQGGDAPPTTDPAMLAWLKRMGY